MPRSPHSDLTLSFTLVGFCGRIYPLICDVSDRWTYGGKEVTHIEPGQCWRDVGSVISHFAGQDIVREDGYWRHNRRVELCKELADEEQKKSRRASRRTLWLNPWSRFPFTKSGWESFIEDKRAVLEARHDDLFRELDCPFFRISSSDMGLLIRRNPHLGRIGFMTIKDSWTAWQDIDMYLSNQLARQMDPDAAGTTDVIRRDMAGFDNASFKSTAPGERKARRRANRKAKRGQEE